MKTPVIPQTYQQWHHFITVECGIPLTRAFAEERLDVWSNPGADERRRFEQLYGPAHLTRVRKWFAQALEQNPQQP
ncbi:MAG: hypothetical protein FJY39_12790 [Betaproteobacteria bacterium]|nr:hypothetical protein [Betaproteobacteria bacterium]